MIALSRKITGEIFNKGTVVGMETFERAVDYKYYSFKVLACENKIATLQRKIENKADSNGKRKYTNEQVKGFKSELEIEKQNLANFEKSVEVRKANYEEVVAEMGKNADNFLGVCGACYERGLWKYAINQSAITDETWEELLTNFWTIHVDGKYNSEGVTRNNDKSAKACKVAVKSIVHELFTIEENKYTKKINININAGDLNKLHETFVTTWTANTKKSDAGIGFKEWACKTSIQKKTDRDGNVTYKADNFCTLLAEIIFSKISC